MLTVVDTNVLAEVLGGGSRSGAALHALLECSRRGRLVVSAVVWAELLVTALDPDVLDKTLDGMRIEVDWHLDKGVWVEATRAWGEDLRRRKLRQPYPCPHCGHQNELHCAACGKSLVGQRRIPNDFLVGAHALMVAGRLITWDRGTYATYFPGLLIHHP